MIGNFSKKEESPTAVDEAETDSKSESFAGLYSFSSIALKRVLFKPIVVFMTLLIGSEATRSDERNVTRDFISRFARI